MFFLKRLDNKGIALMTALMMTVMTLSIIMGVMYLISENITSTASRKSYRNVLEASYGGAELVSKAIMPQLFNNISTSVLRSSFSTLSPSFTSSNCLRNKMSNATNMWGTSSSCNSSLNPKIASDMSLELSGADGVGYKVYAKIVDTVPGVPYSDASNEAPLVGGGVQDNSAGTTTEMRHFQYRIEITGERKNNPSEKSNLSVLYEY